MFRDYERAIRFGFDDGIADVREIGHVLPACGAVSAGTLRAALDDVAGNDSRRETIPIVRFPIETLDHGREGESGIGAAAGDDDVGAGCERLGEREGSNVGVDAGDLVAYFAE